jgi:hypothetical protein
MKNLIVSSIILASIVVLSSTACFLPSDCEGDYSLSADFTPDERADAAEAAARWNSFSDKVHVRIHPAGEAGKCRITNAKLGLAKNGLRQESVEHSPSGLIEIDRAWMNESCVFPDCRVALFAHAIGHSFGMYNLSPGQRGIMASPRTESDTEFTPADLAECQEHGPC